MKLPHYSTLGIVSLLFAIASGINGAPVQFQSSIRQTALVELFTSEGCSSCPPAEAWVTRLKGEPGLWRDFVPVAFHVDYWDYLGWRDKWSSKQFSDRQREYAQAWESDSIYTPGFVVNGKEWRGWMGQRTAPPGCGSMAGVLTVASQDGAHWQVNFAPVLPTLSYEVSAALLGCGLGSAVKAGENAGRNLKHDFAALTLVRQPLVSRNNKFEATFSLAVPQDGPGGRLALAVWVTHDGSMEPVQATGGWLEAAEKKSE